MERFDGFNLLSHPCFRVEDGNGQRALSLPQVLAALSSGAEFEFSGIRPHQAHPWHAFVTQAAALAMHAAADNSFSTEAEEWYRRLLLLTLGEDNPWTMIVEDLSLPAFLQPPVPEKSLARFKPLATPDQLDLLLTSRNHDLKTLVMRGARVEHWVYALVSLQGSQGYSGPTYYGVARMNSGYGNRAGFSLSENATWSARFVRDTRGWLEERTRLIESFGYRESNGKALLWLEPWDGRDCLDLGECDPLFLEVCRRVRLVRSCTGVIEAGITGTACARLLAGDTKGDVGDIWTPIRIGGDEVSALTVSAKGLDYKLLQELLFGGEYAQPAAMKHLPGETGPMLFTARALVRGQCRTDGYHERELNIPSPVRKLMTSPHGREKLGTLSRTMVEFAADVRRRLLLPSLIALIQVDPKKPDWKDARLDKWTGLYEAKLNSAFFVHLWDSVSDEIAELEWVRQLVTTARGVVDQAILSVPLPSAHRYRAIAAAERMFAAVQRKRFPLNTNEGGSHVSSNNA